MTIHNRKYNDAIVFDIEELTEESRQVVLRQVHARGWDDKDCWIEVEGWMGLKYGINRGK